MPSTADLQVWMPGTEVELAPFGDDPLTGVVIEVSIQAHGYVGYHVAYWDGRDRRTSWLEHFEVRGKEGKRKRVGLINGEGS
jgi:hypothetical protein